MFEKKNVCMYVDVTHFYFSHLTLLTHNAKKQKRRIIECAVDWQWVCPCFSFILTVSPPTRRYGVRTSKQNEMAHSLGGLLCPLKHFMVKTGIRMKYVQMYVNMLIVYKRLYRYNYVCTIFPSNQHL